MRPRTLAYRQAEERLDEMKELAGQVERILRDEVMEAERLLEERGYAVLATPQGPRRVASIDDFVALQHGHPAPSVPYVAPPDPKPVIAPRPPGPPRGPRRGGR